jgi:hypothetical protein
MARLPSDHALCRGVPTRTAESASRIVNLGIGWRQVVSSHRLQPSSVGFVNEQMTI